MARQRNPSPRHRRANTPRNNGNAIVVPAQARTAAWTRKYRIQFLQKDADCRRTQNVGMHARQTGGGASRGRKRTERQHRLAHSARLPRLHHALHNLCRPRSSEPPSKWPEGDFQPRSPQRLCLVRYFSWHEGLILTLVRLFKLVNGPDVLGRFQAPYSSSILAFVAKNLGKSPSNYEEELRKENKTFKWGYSGEQNVADWLKGISEGNDLLTEKDGRDHWGDGSIGRLKDTFEWIGENRESLAVSFSSHSTPLASIGGY